MGVYLSCAVPVVVECAVYKHVAGNEYVFDRLVDASLDQLIPLSTEQVLVYVPIGLMITGRDSGTLAPVAPNRTIGASNIVVAKGFILGKGIWRLRTESFFPKKIPPNVVNGVVRIPIDLRGDIVII